jgi:predicted transcriptional regulator
MGDYMGIEKKTKSIRLDEDLIEALEKIAGSENRSLSNLIETVLKRYVAENDNDAVE